MMTTPTATIFVPYHALDDVIQRGPRASQPAATAVVPGTLYGVTDEGDLIERSNGTVWEAYSPVPSGGGGTGDVVGPASAVDNTVALYSGGTGKVLKDASQVTVDAATGNVTTPGSLTAGGLATTPLNASNLSSGTVADARLSSNVPLKNAANTFTAAQTISVDYATLYLNHPSATANARRIGLTSDGTLNVSARDDAGTIQTNILSAWRTGDVYIYRDIYEKQRTTPMGHWIAVPFNAGNFSAAGSMVWTVEAGDVALNRYTVIGKTLIWSFYLNATSLSGTASAQLLMTIPSGFTVLSGANGITGQLYDGVNQRGLIIVATPSTIAIQKDPSVSFTLNTNGTYVIATVTMEII
jgi:hypothetical protein